MQGFREFLQTSRGKLTAAALAGVALLVFGLVYRAHFSTSAAGRASADRMFICSQTGKTFRHTLHIGQTIPVKSPHSGKMTGYEADSCYWTREGTVKAEPVYVYVAQRWGGSGPTFCPDCGRLVRPLNPAPFEGAKPPPTAAEYQARNGGGMPEER